MKALIVIITIALVSIATSAFADQNMAITFCDNAITDGFHPSVVIQFPKPIVTENNNAFFVHYKGNNKLITGGGANRVDARCTIDKVSYEIIFLNIAGRVVKQ